MASTPGASILLLDDTMKLIVFYRMVVLSWSRRFPIGTNKQEIHESTKKTYGTAQKK